MALVIYLYTSIYIHALMVDDIMYFSTYIVSLSNLSFYILLIASCCVGVCFIEHPDVLKNMNRFVNQI